MQIMGYTVDYDKQDIDSEIVPYWRCDLTPVQRLEAPIKLSRREVRRLTAHLHEYTGTQKQDGVWEWKEEMVRGMSLDVW